LAEAERSAPELAALGADRIVVADASAWFSRLGPRLIEGLEWLGHVLHPDRVPEPAAGVRELVLSPR
jgi:iron complex transport system substrate-binding protein